MSEIVGTLEALIAKGLFLEARSRAEVALNTDPNVRLKQLFALALSKSGSPERACAFLEPEYQTNPHHSETAGILGGIYKELFKQNQKTEFAFRARETYLKNFETTGNYYTGINAASMTAMLMQASRAKEIANRVVASIPPDTADFWELATLAEAQLLLKNREKSVSLYTAVRRLIGADWGKLVSISNQLWLLEHYISVPQAITNLFKPPGVAAFVGHMIDRPDRTVPRFPASLESVIKDAIRAQLRSANIQIGFCSLACGSDILFAEALVEMGGEVNAILPFKKTDFVETSLLFAGSDWVNRFEALMGRVSSTFVTQESYAQQDELFSFQSKVIFGAAVIRAQSYHSEPFLVSVLAETDLQQKEGGTRDALVKWPFASKVININPEVYLGMAPAKATEPPQTLLFGGEPEQPVRYLIAANLSGLSPLAAREVDAVIRKALSDNEIAEYREDEWVILGFSSVNMAIASLHQLVLLLPKAPEVATWRIALHAGPFTKQRNESEAWHRLTNLCQLIGPSEILATFPFAALLVIESTLFKLQIAGRTGGWNDQPEDVFQIELT